MLGPHIVVLKCKRCTELQVVCRHFGGSSVSIMHSNGIRILKLISSYLLSRQGGRAAGRQTGREAVRQSGRQAGKEVGRQSGRQQHLPPNFKH